MSLHCLFERPVVYARIDYALHQRPSVVVFDISPPSVLRNGELVAESLLFEVPDGKVVRISQKVSQMHLFHMLLEKLIHHNSAKAFDLLRRFNGAKSYFCEALLYVRPETNSSTTSPSRTHTSDMWFLSNTSRVMYVSGILATALQTQASSLLAILDSGAYCHLSQVRTMVCWSSPSSPRYLLPTRPNE